MTKMNRPINISCFIKLITKEALDEEVMKKWYRCVAKYTPTGVVLAAQATTAKGMLKNCSLIHREFDNKNEYVVPLSRDLGDSEAEPVVEAFVDLYPDLDFNVEVSSAQVDVYKPKTAEIMDDKFTQLCSSWAKRQHDTWMKERLESGWRFGATINLRDKTHPLLKPWHELPDKFKQIDTTQPQSLLDLLNDQGYAVISKTELEAILRLIKGSI